MIKRLYYQILPYFTRKVAFLKFSRLITIILSVRVEFRGT
jgi:hypothetical protein